MRASSLIALFATLAVKVSVLLIQTNYPKFRIRTIEPYWLLKQIDH